MPVSNKFLANSFAKFYVRREPSSRRTLVRSGCNFFPRTNFLVNRSPVRGGVRANSGLASYAPVSACARFHLLRSDRLVNPGFHDSRFGYQCAARSDYNNILVVSVKVKINLNFVLIFLHN